MKRITEKQANAMLEYIDRVFEGKTFPLDNKNTYELLSRGDTDGIYMMETDWDKYDLRQIQPHNMDELIAAVTFSHGYELNPYIYTYIKRTFIQPYTYPIYTHIPEVDEILRESHGVLLYNEQKTAINKIVDEMSVDDKEKYKIPISIIHHEMKLHHTSDRSFFAKRALLCYKQAYIKANMPNEFDKLHKQLISE